MLELNFANMLETLIGERGLSEREIEAMKCRVAAVHEQIAGRSNEGLAFMDLPRQDTSEIKRLGEWVKESSDDFLVLGIGGSALGPRSILEALSPFHNLRKRPRAFICDNVDPGTLGHVLSLIDIRKAAVNVITKSGSTAETMATFMVIWDELFRALGEKGAERVIATTDPEKGNLRKIVLDRGLKSLPIPQAVGGRYSVLSPVGLLLAEVIGVDSKEMLEGARDIGEKCVDPDIWKNPAYLFGLLLYMMATEEKRNVNILIPYADNLKSLAEWFCQLWSESLGKEGMGITPYPSLGAVDQHSQLQLWMEGPEDKVVVFIRVRDFGTDIKIPETFKEIEGISYLGGHTLSELINAEAESSEVALAKKRRPNMTITIPSIDPYYLGQLYHFFEIATAFTGLLMGINPFDQPGVEEGKNLTYGMMGKKGFEARREEVEKARARRICFTI